VRLLISSGPREVEVPRVVGLTRSSAESALEAQGLGVIVERRRSEEPEDEVLSQSPDGGATVEEGAAVSIAVSTGPADEREREREPRDTPSQEEDQRTTVPGVVGLSPGAASSRLRAAGFGVARTTRRVADGDRDGIVIDQAPGAGAERREGSTITIVVGRGQESNNSGEPDPDPKPPPDPPGPRPPLPPAGS
jgi:serine/threonine-protein kinase